ncbi:nitroreductase family protein [Rhodoluna sp.]|uniref:nitroreductase family protein n=1 Tax=Rhodoluna sp. TaxID=1969481 RepID=UPI0025CEF820|nr:nitroreductase family protein [Rhodoluna sp.]
MTSKTAVTAAPIAPVLAERWSPRSFDHNYELTQHELLSILEAARWAASGNNFQPWRFGVAVRGSKEHATVAARLSGFNAAWAPHASALIVASVLTHAPDGTAYGSGQFDLGLAVSSLMIQAHELGLHAHVVGGFDRDALKVDLGLEEALVIPVLVVVGRVAPAEQLEGPAREREIAPRVRHDLDDILLFGKP